MSVFKFLKKLSNEISNIMARFWWGPYGPRKEDTMEEMRSDGEIKG